MPAGDLELRQTSSKWDTTAEQKHIIQLPGAYHFAITTLNNRGLLKKGRDAFLITGNVQLPFNLLLECIDAADYRKLICPFT